MAGIYIHIPFCKTKCPYCDFYSVTNWDRDLQIKFVNAVLREIDLRKDFIKTPVKTIYFGGGTPSLLEPEQLQTIVEKIRSVFQLKKTPLEITAELNPDDVTADYVYKLKNETSVNRISLGVQSFIDDDLKFLSRRHNSDQSISAIRLLQKAQFTNISIDIIYGLPGTDKQKLKYNLDMFLAFDLPHLSAYHLTYEQDTPFGKLLKTGKIKPLAEENSIKLFDFLINYMNEYHYLHYEISNFAKENFISQHNFSYWTGEEYLGLGPAAHSYDGNIRSWNIANLDTYLKGINTGKPIFQKEHLTERDKFNEYILTHLRIYLGIKIDFLETNYARYYNAIKPTIMSYIESGHLKQNKGNIVLTHAGKKIVDTITADLFI